MSSSSASAASTSENPIPTKRDEDKTLKIIRQTEFLHFNPLAFVDDVVGAINDYACDACDGLEASVAKAAVKRSHNEMIRQDVNSGCEKLLDDLLKSIDRNFDLFEMYLQRNIFKLPEGQSAAQAGADGKALSGQELGLIQAKDRARALLYFNHALEQQNTRITEEIGALEECVAQLDASLKSGAPRALGRVIRDSEQLSQLIGGAIDENLDRGSLGAGKASAKRRRASHAHVINEDLKAISDFFKDDEE